MFVKKLAGLISILVLSTTLYAVDGQNVREGKTADSIDVTTIDMQGNSFLNGLDNIDSITKATLEAALTFLKTESDPLALKIAGTDNIKDTHIDWGTGVGQVSADDIPDGSTNAIITLTQETNFETAYGWGNHASAGYLGTASTGVTGDWIINSDLADVTSTLTFGRTIGGSATITWDGSYFNVNRAVMIPLNYKQSFGQSSLYNFNIYKVGAGYLHTYFDSFDDEANTNIYFRMRTAGTPINILTLAGSGQVGINTTSFIGTEKLRVNGSAYLDGALNVAGGQITFPATQTASSNANTLDDYEEGEWNPTITGSTSGSFTLDSSLDTAIYTKIGRVVTVYGQLQANSENSPVGNIEISLPFASAQGTDNAGRSIGTCSLTGHGGNLPNVTVIVSGNSSIMYLLSTSDDGSTINIDEGDIDSSWTVTFSLTYFSAN
jgi:hypothetical protein